TLFPYTTLFRSFAVGFHRGDLDAQDARQRRVEQDKGELPGLKGVEAVRRQAALQPSWGDVDWYAGAQSGPGRRLGGAEIAADHGLEAADVAPGARRFRIPEARAEVPAEAVVGFDDARLDHHLTHRDVDLGEQPAHLLQVGRRVLDEQRVGARVDHGAAALGEDALARVREQLLHVGRLLVVHLERFGARLLEVVDRLSCLERELLARGELVARRDPDHVAGAAAVEAARLQDDVERLVPGHVLQAQGDVPGHRVA